MAKAPARKKPHGASRNNPKPAASKGAPGWVWLLTGFVTACFVFFLVHLKQGEGGIGKVLPALPGSGTAATAKSGAAVAAANSGSADDSAASDQQRFDFYTLLPNQKMIPNQDATDAANKAGTAAAALAAKKQAAAALAQSGQQPMQAMSQQPLNPATSPATEPQSPAEQAQQPVSPATPLEPVQKPASKPAVAEEPVKPETPAAKAETPPKAEATAKTEAPAKVETPAKAEAPAKAATAAKPAKGSYFLQAGSFKSEGEADRRRANILMLGLPVQTKMVEKDSQNWYRVIVGPMDSKDSADAARNTLQGGGIQSVPAGHG
jgi:cell division protein FtsN